MRSGAAIIIGGNVSGYGECRSLGPAGLQAPNRDVA